MKKHEYFADTDETIVSDLTSDEISELELAQADALALKEAQEAEQTSKAAAKLSAKQKLTALGLSDEEIAALLG